MSFLTSLAILGGLPLVPRSYARKLVTVTSGGVLDWLDSVLERYSFDELGEVA